MNIFDLIKLLAFLAGSCVSVYFGFKWFGMWMGIVCIPIGVGIGFVTAYATLFVFAVVFSIFGGGPLFPRKPAGDNDSSQGSA